MRVDITVNIYMFRRRCEGDDEWDAILRQVNDCEVVLVVVMVDKLYTHQ